MNSFAFLTLLNDLVADFSEPAVLWQIGALLLSCAMGWSLARMLQSLFSATDRPLMTRLGTDTFARVLVPVISLLFVYASKQILSHWLNVHLLRLATPIFISIALIRFTLYLLSPLVSRAGNKGRVLHRLEKAFMVLVWCWAALYLTGLWPELMRLLEEVTFTVGVRTMSVLSILQAIASVIVTVLLALWFSAVVEKRVMRMEEVGSSLRMVMVRMVHALLIMGALLVSLTLVGFDLTILSVFGGALGVGLGLGLQRIASNYVSGFLILLERSLKIDDLITVATFSGKVTQINTRYTILQGLDGVESIIPNEMLVSSPVQNYSLSDRSIMLTTDIVIGYQNDIESVKTVLESAAAGVERVSKEKPPKSLLMKFTADGFEFRLGFWIVDPERGNAGVISAVNQAIWQALQSSQIKVPFIKEPNPAEKP